jgi:acyl-CoA thioesterase-1
MSKIFRLQFIKYVLTLMLAVASPITSANGAGSTILVLGDSLSAAYGIPRDQGWVALLQQKLDLQQPGRYRVINASISGETTSGGRSRLQQLLAQHTPDLVLLQLGGNDGLRGLPVRELRQNLTAMIESSQHSGARVALLGILIPPNYGPRYTQEFRESYSLLAKQYQLALVPFLLEGVAGKADLMQEDGLHPTTAAQPILLENVWRILAPQFRPLTAKKQSKAPPAIAGASR